MVKPSLRRFAFGYPAGLTTAVALSWILNHAMAGQFTWSTLEVVATVTVLCYFVLWCILGPAKSLTGSVRERG